MNKLTNMKTRLSEIVIAIQTANKKDSVSWDWSHGFSAKLTQAYDFREV